jgi:membrane protein
MGEARDPVRRAASSELLRRVVAVVSNSTLTRVYARYAVAGGPLFASGLAYNALFAIVPAIVLTLGVASILLGSGADQTSLIEMAGRAFPPLLELLGPITSELERLSGSVTILGLLGFIWGASRFTIALDAALALILGGGTSRGAMRTQVIALASVGLLVAAVVALAILAGFASMVEGASIGPAAQIMDPIVGLLLTVVGPAAGVVGLAAVYCYVPTRRPSWRDALLPALVVGGVLALATRLFVVLAPRLIGAAAVFGSLAAVFIALAWFGATFQALLVGAAWVGDRADRRRLAEDEGQPPP